MPAKSKSQQKLFGMVHAFQKGELKGASPEVEKIAKGISYKDADAFASTKHKGLPERKPQKESYFPTWSEWLLARKECNG